MKKKLILFLISFSVFAIGGFVATYHSYQNKNIDNRALSIKATSPMLSYHQLKESILDHEGDHYFWFVDNDNPNSTFIKEQLIDEFLITLNVDSFKNLEIVDFTGSNYSKDRMKKRYNLTDTTGFIKAQVKEGTITYSDGLSFDDQSPITKEMLEKWLYEHGIWQATYNSLHK